MPGAVPITSTWALTNVTLTYVEAIAAKGVQRAVTDDPALAKGVNVAAGLVTYQPIAEAVGLEYHSLDEAMGLHAA
jgi:alanine dehydrogenase